MSEKNYCKQTVKCIKNLVKSELGQEVKRTNCQQGQPTEHKLLTRTVHKHKLSAKTGNRTNRQEMLNNLIITNSTKSLNYSREKEEAEVGSHPLVQI